MRVKQALLRSVLPDGTVVLLVVLHDDRCAIVRNADVIHEAAGDADGIDGAVQRFMAMTQTSDVVGGADVAASRDVAGTMRADVTRGVDPLAGPAAAAAATSGTGAAAPPAAST